MCQKAMTVKELKEQLSMYSDDQIVYFSYNYGDHWGTTVAAPVTNISSDSIKWSDYHRMHKIADLENEVNHEEIKKVIVIS